jgi:hypothetical protein
MEERSPSVEELRSSMGTQTDFMVGGEDGFSREEIARKCRRSRVVDVGVSPVRKDTRRRHSKKRFRDCQKKAPPPPPRKPRPPSDDDDDSDDDEKLRPRHQYDRSLDEPPPNVSVRHLEYCMRRSCCARSLFGLWKHNIKKNANSFARINHRLMQLEVDAIIFRRKMLGLAHGEGKTMPAIWL